MQVYNRLTLLSLRAALSLFMAIGCLAFASLPAQHAAAFGYLFAELNGTELVTHPHGYNGTGGVLNVTVGIDNTSANAAAMMTSVQNAVNTWNQKVATTQNFDFSTISPSEVDFESVLLHELGHSLGLSHVNLASESGLVDPDANHTKALMGTDGMFNLDDGADNVTGSSDDLRGDDVNLNWFHRGTNDPFELATVAGVVDVTTYSIRTTNLPGSDTFSANGDRTVSILAGQPGTEAIMQQGTFFGEAQRTLAADDVAAIRYGESGRDEIAGTSDDYTLNLQFVGFVAPSILSGTSVVSQGGADIVIDFDNAQTGFAISQSGGVFIDTINQSSGELFQGDEEALLDADGNVLAGGANYHTLNESFDEAFAERLEGNQDDDLFSNMDDAPVGAHTSVTTSNIFFNENFNWHFNQVSNAVPEPGSLGLLLLLAGLGIARHRE